MRFAIAAHAQRGQLTYALLAAPPKVTAYLTRTYVTLSRRA